MYAAVAHEGYEAANLETGTAKQLEHSRSQPLSEQRSYGPAAARERRRSH